MELKSQIKRRCVLTSRTDFRRRAGEELVIRRMSPRHSRGGLPLNSDKRRAPTACMSVVGETVSPANCSGAPKPGVPSAAACSSANVRLCAAADWTVAERASLSTCAIPRSVSTARPELSSKTFVGFMSRWTTPLPWRNSRPSRMSHKTRRIVRIGGASGIGRSRSIVKYGRPSVSPNPWTRIIPGLSNCASRRASERNLSRWMALSGSARIFRARSRFSASSRTRQTSLVAPRPRNATTRSPDKVSPLLSSFPSAESVCRTASGEAR